MAQRPTCYTLSAPPCRTRRRTSGQPPPLKCPRLFAQCTSHPLLPCLPPTLCQVEGEWPLHITPLLCSVHTCSHTCTSHPPLPCPSISAALVEVDHPRHTRTHLTPCPHLPCPPASLTLGGGQVAAPRSAPSPTSAHVFLIPTRASPYVLPSPALPPLLR